jgi:hypothetical protein
MVGSQESQSLECRFGQGFCQMSTTSNALLVRSRRCFDFTNFAKINAKIQLAKNRNCYCTKFRHTPVDALHSLENKRDKIATKQLTYKMAVVKTHSFFDSFQGSSGWR